MLQLTSQINPAFLDETEEGTHIKGFASVEDIDRFDEIVSPEAFNVETFMNSPTLLANHKFWNDAQGNKVAAGSVVQMNRAYISGEEGDNYLVSDISSKQVINFIPKKNLPEVSVGTKGLFVRARVTQPEVATRVQAGDYGGFSWKGFTRKSKVVRNGKLVDRLHSVDLLEVSIVNGPVQNQSNYVVGKSVGHASTEQYIYQIQFDKETNNLESVKSYLGQHDLEDANINETDTAYFAVVGNSSECCVEKSVRVKMGDVSLIMAPMKDLEEVELVGEIRSVPVVKSVEISQKLSQGKTMKLFSFDDKALEQLFVSYNTSTKSVQIGDKDVEVTCISGTKVLDLEAEIGAKLEVVKSTIEKLESASSKIDVLEAELKELKDAKEAAEVEAKDRQEAEAKAKETADAEAAAKATETNTKVEATEQTLEETQSAVLEVAKSVQGINEQMEKVVKSIQGLAKGVPTKKEEISKSVNTDDADSKYNSAFDLALFG